MNQREPRRSQLTMAVRIAALVAPALHLITDVLEWFHGGFSTAQLWLNYVAFLPMPWLLLGLYAVHEPRQNLLGLIGAGLYGVAFTYFAHTALYAIAEGIPNYEALWSRLGTLYAVHGTVMVIGGFLFVWSALLAGWRPRWPLLLFASGLSLNLLLALIPSPEILQTIGSALRNSGLMAMGYAVLFQRRPGTA